MVKWISLRSSEPSLGVRIPPGALNSFVTKARAPGGDSAESGLGAQRKPDAVERRRGREIFQQKNTRDRILTKLGLTGLSNS